MNNPVNENYNATLTPTVDDLYLRNDITLADRVRNTRVRRVAGISGLALYAMTMFSVGVPSIARAEEAQGDVRAPITVYNGTNENSVSALARQGSSPNPEKNFAEKLFTLEYALDDDINQGNYGQVALKFIPNCAVKLSVGTVVGVAYPFKQAWDFRQEAYNYEDSEERTGHLIGRSIPPFFAMIAVGNFFRNIVNYMMRKPWDFGGNAVCAAAIAVGAGAFEGGGKHGHDIPQGTTGGAPPIGP